VASIRPTILSGGSSPDRAPPRQPRARAGAAEGAGLRCGAQAEAPRAPEALQVSQCESGFDVNARNGQYLGLFQMGSTERRIFGHGASAEDQAKAAHRYFLASGSDWSPWSCKPW